MEACRKRRIVEEAWSPLMRGKITQLEVVTEIANRKGKTPAQVVLRWNLQHGVVTIPKSVKRDRLVENASLYDFELTAEEMARIDALDKGERVGPNPDNFTF
jgi:diketogulonate reductase-like aldo/keto reductase